MFPAYLRYNTYRMSEFVDDKDNQLKKQEWTGEAAEHEYAIRVLNNEIFELTQQTEMRLEDFHTLQELLARKASLILQRNLSSYPEMAVAIREMMAAKKNDDDSVDTLELLRQILEELLEARQNIHQGDEARYAELTTMIDSIEKLIVAHVADHKAHNI